MINQSQFTAFVRQMLQVLGTGLASYGVVSPNGALWMFVTGTIIGAVPVIWGYIRNSRYGSIIAAADVIADEGGKVTLPDRAEALAIPRDNVVPAPATPKAA